MGCLALAGFIHMLTGMFGLVGFVMKYVGPITVIPTVLLIGLNAFKVTTKFCQVHYFEKLVQIILIVVLKMR
jgi:nucleobase transporter 1/2